MKPKYKRLVDEELQKPETKELLKKFNEADDNKELGDQIFATLEGLYIEWGSEIPEQLYDSIREDGETKISDYFWEQAEKLKCPSNDSK